MRNAEARLRAAGDDRRGRQEDERQGREPSVERKAARRDAAPSREAPEPDAEGSTEQERSDRPPRRPVEGQRWQEEAAIVEEDEAEDVEAVLRPRQRLQKREIPEEQMQEQRDVAEELDIGRRCRGDEAVLGQARETDDEADPGREQDADEGDGDGVGQRHQQGGEIGRLLVIGQERLRDLEARRPRQEIEAGAHAEALQVLRDILADIEDEGGDERKR